MIWYRSISKRLEAQAAALRFLSFTFPFAVGVASQNMSSANRRVNQENKRFQSNALASSPLVFFGGGLLDPPAAGFFFQATLAFLTSKRYMVEIDMGNWYVILHQIERNTQKPLLSTDLDFCLFAKGFGAPGCSVQGSWGKQWVGKQLLVQQGHV